MIHRVISGRLTMFISGLVMTVALFLLHPQLANTSQDHP
jgi:hypothetical protein